MAQRVAIGDDLYLFHGDTGRSKYLVISSHGETLRRTFKVPNGTNLLFYAPPNHILQMHANFRLGIQVQEEVLAGSTSQDYGLSKFQGGPSRAAAFRGGGDETYTSIAASIDRTRRSIEEGVQTFDQFVTAAGPLPQGMSPERLAPQFKAYLSSKANLLPMDILTIRARGMRALNIGTVSLSAVLDTLKRHNISYPYVFCSFCRYTRGLDNTHMTVDY